MPRNRTQSAEMHKAARASAWCGVLDRDMAGGGARMLGEYRQADADDISDVGACRAGRIAREGA